MGCQFFSQKEVFYDDRNATNEVFLRRKSNFGENKEQSKITDLLEYTMMAQQPYEDWEQLN